MYLLNAEKNTISQKFTTSVVNFSVKQIKQLFLFYAIVYGNVFLYEDQLNHSVFCHSLANKLYLIYCRRVYKGKNPRAICFSL